MIKNLKIIGISFIVLWLVFSWGAFLTSDMIAKHAPESWELPWSDFIDFVEDKYGNVYVYLFFYGRLQCYDRQGKFVASYPIYYGGGGDKKLATCSKGYIYFRSNNIIKIFDRNMKEINKVYAKVTVKNDWITKYFTNTTWILQSNGNPVYAPDRSYDTVPDRVIEPGEMLFSDHQERRRQYFSCADGTKLVRRGNEIIRYVDYGKDFRTYRIKVLHTYKTPWYLWWVKFPMPAAFIGWIIPFAIGIIYTIHEKVKKWTGEPDESAYNSNDWS